MTGVFYSEQPTIKIFTQIDDDLYNFMELKKEESEPSVIRSFITGEPLNEYLERILKNTPEIQGQNVFNPVYSLITGDKLNDTNLIDFSLSLFDFDLSYVGVLELHVMLCEFLKKHCLRDTTREKIDAMLCDNIKSYQKNPPKWIDWSFNSPARPFRTKILSANTREKLGELFSEKPFRPFP
jgi:hypothetical protein